MKECTLTVGENTPLTPSVYRMRLAGDVSAVTTPGQFINLKLAGRFLRRPISVSDREGESVTILYKVVGQGTEQMAAMGGGMTLSALTGLGNGFDASPAGDSPLLIGGGIGAAPLYWLARELRAAGKQVTVLLGFNTKSEIFYTDEFRALGCDLLSAPPTGAQVPEAS